MSAFTWTDADIRAALGLRAERADREATYAGVSTDSRTVGEGQLYVALQGERFDGHDFVADAFSKGAAGAVVSKPVVGDDIGRIYPVDDTLVALGALAAHRRDELDAPVVAITGSAGKTTTKDLTAAALSGRLRVHATRGNLNNRIGMPLTLLAAPADAEAVVLELGSNEPGEIATLAAVARPDIGVVTTVGESHLEKLGDLDGVLSEKLDLLRGLTEGGRCVVGDEPPLLAEEARTVCSHVRVAGWSERADEDLRPQEAEADHWGAYRFQWRGARATLSLPGRHAVANAMLALAVADLLGVDPGKAVAGLDGVQAGDLRSEFRRVGDLTLIVDCYNANPQSVRAALDLLEDQEGTGRVAVLGTMLELGRHQARLHAEVLAAALERELDLVVATGAFARAAEERSGTAGDRLLAAESWSDAYPGLRARLDGHEVVLLKASRGVAMEGLVPLFQKDFGNGADDGHGSAADGHHDAADGHGDAAPQGEAGNAAEGG